jgi:MFS family permease
LLNGKAFTAQFPEIDVLNGGSASLQGTVVAIYEIGCLFGSLATFVGGEYLGRRRTIMLGCIILSIGAAIQTASYGIPQLIVGRIVAGVGNGINTSTIPVWHSECSTAEQRGKALCIELALTIFGIVSGKPFFLSLSLFKTQECRYIQCGISNTSDGLILAQLRNGLCSQSISIPIPNRFPDRFRHGHHRSCPFLSRVASVATQAWASC